MTRNSTDQKNIYYCIWYHKTRLRQPCLETRRGQQGPDDSRLPRKGRREQVGRAGRGKGEEVVFEKR